MVAPILTAEYLRSILSYDAKTGEFVHIARRQAVIVGTVAGSTDNLGYRKHRIDGKFYKGHRLAWLHHHGKWPEGEIDHINGQRSDNRIANLRDVPRARNSENQRFARECNKSGLLGVCSPCGHDKKFKAMISVGGKGRTLGRFDTAEAAHQCYLEAKRKLHAGCTI